MTSLNKALMIIAVGFAMGTTANLAQANCGTCGVEKEHKHDGNNEKKTVCVKCAHAKVCTADNCTDAAHAAKCTCNKKTACVKCAHGKVCTAEEGCEDAAHIAECTCPAKKEKMKDKAA